MTAPAQTQARSVGRPPIVCHGHARPIVDVNWSVVTDDGFFLASASKDGLPMLRHGETGDWYGTFQGHKGAVWSCVLNRPALLAATGSADFTARIWDACTGNELHQFQHGHIVRSTAFAHGSNKLATGGMEKIVRIFDIEKPSQAPEQLGPQPANIRCLAWLHDDNLLLCSYGDKNGISVIDTRSKETVQTLETDAPVTSLEVSYDGKYLTTAEGRVVRMFHTDSLQQFKMHKLIGANNAESASYCAARNVFAAGGEDMWVRLFNADTGAELECNKGHHGPVHAVRFAPTYESYASGSEDGTIRIYSLDNNSNGPATNAQ